MNNEPAFPFQEISTDPMGYAVAQTNFGLTKREWFAGMALQGLLASGKDLASFVSEAFLYADEMISESEKQKP